MTSREYERVLVVSIDGVAVRAIDRATTPTICGLARAGAACFTARTIVPPLTLPAHASMLRGVAPDVHGVTANGTHAADGAPSFLLAARNAGRSTALVVSWQPLAAVVEDAAAEHCCVLDGGYDLGDDDRVVEAAADVLERIGPDVTFAYLTGPDLVGHEAGWGSTAYRAALSRADTHLAALVAAAGPDTAIVVTTDHGGEGTHHDVVTAATMETFVVVRSHRIIGPSSWDAASILDIAPIVADLSGFASPPAWTGTSLVDSSTPVVDALCDLLESLALHEYGEDLDALAHSLQTAAHAERAGADRDLVIAALFHDIGHLLDVATDWGVPTHSLAGARALQPWFDAAVTGPIRLHVDAKRCLVATDAGYCDRLSRASQESLRQQGGPFDAQQVAAFAAEPFSADAVTLRRWDDAGKIPDADTPSIEHYRPLISAALSGDGSEGESGDGTNTPISAAWARDSCSCAHCRDPSTGQHLLDVGDLAGWRTISSGRDVTGNEATWVVLIENEEGERHRCLVPLVRPPRTVATTWGSEHVAVLRDRSPASDDDFVAALDRYGIALTGGVPPRTGEVLAFAHRIGFVRTTNYGDAFDVVAQAAPINLANTPSALALHTDNPYRDPVPTVQLLHCISAGEHGGCSRFADGLRAAQQLRTDAPEDFDVLTRVPVDFRFAAAGVDLRASVPLISLAADGTISRITVNNRSMAPQPLHGDSDAFFRAYRRFAARLADPTNMIEITLRPGELIAFDNRRVLHGRGAFAPDGTRFLQGCYVDIDAIRSRAALQRRR